MTPTKYQRLLKSDLKVLDLPEPEHKYGFPYSQLKNCLTFYDLKRLDKWMYGQTCMKDIESGDLVYYTDDVVRGLKLIRYGIPTFWD